MRWNSCKDKRWIKLFFLILVSGFMASCEHESAKSSTPLPVNYQEQPSIGDPKASVHVVVFEDPKCPACKKFTTLIFPLLKQDYIDTQKVRFTLIPVSFVPGSMPAAVAWLCVYNQAKGKSNEELTFKYIDYMYANQPSEDTDWANEEAVIKFAEQTSPAIDLNRLKSCMAQSTYRKQIKANTAVGNKIMQGGLATPTVYVNGEQVTQTSYENISRLIDKYRTPNS